MQSAVLAVIHERDLIANFQSFLIRESGIQEFSLVVGYKFQQLNFLFIQNIIILIRITVDLFIGKINLLKSNIIYNLFFRKCIIFLFFDQPRHVP
jgi:hypothetical protein